MKSSFPSSKSSLFCPRLVRYGFLAPEQINNTEAVNEARAAYESEIGESVDVRSNNLSFFNKKRISFSSKQIDLFPLRNLYNIDSLIDHHDDFGFSELGIGRENREAVAEYITSVFEGLKQGNAHEAWQNDLDDIYNPSFYVLRNFDFAGSLYKFSN